MAREAVPRPRAPWDRELRKAVWLALAALVFVLSNAVMQRRKLLQPLAEMLEGVDRFVDAGVELRVVVADAHGERLLASAPAMRVLRTHSFGGVIDTRSQPPYVCAPSRAPAIWYGSEDQEPVVLHGDDELLGQLVYGSEGAGKTTALAMWHALRWLEHLGDNREGGQTAPTSARLELVRAEMAKLWRPHVVPLPHRGSAVRVLRRNAAPHGVDLSPERGRWLADPGASNWSWCGRDEAQARSRYTRTQVDAGQAWVQTSRELFWMRTGSRHLRNPHRLQGQSGRGFVLVPSLHPGARCTRCSSGSRRSDLPPKCRSRRGERL